MREVAGRGAVGLPGLDEGAAVRGSEEEEVAHRREGAREGLAVEELDGRRGGGDVHDRVGAPRRAVARPELGVREAGDEVEAPAQDRGVLPDGGNVVRHSSRGEPRGGGEAVRPPELEVVVGVVGEEDQVAAEGGELIVIGKPRGDGEGVAGSGIEVRHPGRAGGGAVAPPQLRAGDAVRGAEEELAAHHGELPWIRAAAPGRMSLSRAVPGAVPSLLQSSTPPASAAAK